MALFYFIINQTVDMQLVFTKVCHWWCTCMHHCLPLVTSYWYLFYFFNDIACPDHFNLSNSIEVVIIIALFSKELRIHFLKFLEKLMLQNFETSLEKCILIIKPRRNDSTIIAITTRRTEVNSSNYEDCDIFPCSLIWGRAFLKWLTHSLEFGWIRFFTWNKDIVLV